MHRFLGCKQRSSEKNLRQRIDVGLGVHVERLVPEICVGSSNHFIVMGYPVNVASRVQAAIKELNNIVSPLRADYLTPLLLKSKTVSVNLKGITAPCEVHLAGNAYAA